MIDSRGRAWCDSAEHRQNAARALIQITAGGTTVQSAHLCGPCAVHAASEHAQTIVDACESVDPRVMLMGGTITLSPLVQAPR